ncbi:restriction endonuclease [Bacillus sp. Xin]|uniref:restriction endonuclease n=1 Tax=unclassified Bacillus (in: firmicutes) TaxID=185979 RepID=UPI001571EB89|nr:MULTISPECIES: restriction endonuclease [unclassified Bacillus (in: firmicutes)]MBC6976072.1 restriction endonuclease [Bacillus sp. Xin]NSW39056.1 restriction endonuclease [Bacillus sp. Xin1]
MSNLPAMSDILHILICGFILYVLFHICKFVYRKIQERRVLKRMVKSGIHYIDRMDGHQFEVYLKALFRELEYRLEVTKQSNDFGADLVLKGKNRIVIQAKRYGMKNRVGIRAVQEIYAAQAYYKAHEAWVVTNSVYTKQAKELAEACHVKLIDRVELQKLINKVNPEYSAEDVYHGVDPTERKCPVCKHHLVVRNSNKTGNKFFGCSQYPTCAHTEPIHN